MSHEPKVGDALYIRQTTTGHRPKDAKPLPVEVVHVVGETRARYYVDRLSEWRTLEKAIERFNSASASRRRRDFTRIEKPWREGARRMFTSIERLEFSERQWAWLGEWKPRFAIWGQADDPGKFHATLVSALAAEPRDLDECTDCGAPVGDNPWRVGHDNFCEACGPEAEQSKGAALPAEGEEKAK